MRKVLVSIVLIIIIQFSTYAQKSSSTDTTKTLDSTKLNKVSEQLTEILERLKKAEISEKQQIGVISYNPQKPISIYAGKPFKRTGRTILIDKILMSLKDGYIVEIQVFSGDKKFTNARAPITINSMRFSQIDYLENVQNSKEGIVLQQALSFLAFNSYYSDDGLIWLTKDHVDDTLTRNVGINSVVDVRLYTDALGIFGKTPNGVIQTDIRFKQYLRRKNRKNTGQFFGRYVKLNFNASKFDSKRSFEDSATFSKTGLMQKANVNAEVAFNAFTDWIEKKSLSTFYCDVGGGVSVTDFAKLKDTIPVTTQNLFVEMGYNLKSSSNVGMDLYGRFIAQFSPQTDFEKRAREVWFLRFGGEVFWNPFGDVANRLFGRINYTFSMAKVEKKNHYAQVQFGYSVLLTKLAAKGK